MQTTSFKSAPSANAELATANLNAILGQAGGNGNVKVINTGVQEVDGIWIATAFVEIEEPEVKQEDEEKMSVQDRPEADQEKPEDGIVHIYYLQDHKPSVTDQSIPVEPEDALNEALQPPLEQPRVVQVDEDRPQDIPTTAETLGGTADNMAEKVIADFNEPDVIMTAVAAHTPNLAPQAPAEPLDLTEEERQAVLKAREMTRDREFAGLEEPAPTSPEG